MFILLLRDQVRREFKSKSSEPDISLYSLINVGELLVVYRGSPFLEARMST